MAEISAHHPVPPDHPASKQVLLSRWEKQSHTVLEIVRFRSFVHRENSWKRLEPNRNQRCLRTCTPQASIPEEEEVTTFGRKQRKNTESARLRSVTMHSQPRLLIGCAKRSHSHPLCPTLPTSRGKSNDDTPIGCSAASLRTDWRSLMNQAGCDLTNRF